MSANWNVGVLVGDASWHRGELENGELLAEGSGVGFNLGDSIAKHGADFTIEKNPIGFVSPSGGFVQTDDKYAIVRPANVLGLGKSEIFRMVAGRYEPLQNMEIANVLQPLIDAGWHFRGWGVLNDGRMTFAQLDLDPYFIGGLEQEKHVSHLLLGNDHKQGSAFWGNTNTRVVCQNTFNVAIGEEGIESIPHATGTQVELDFRSALQLAVLRQQARQIEQLETLFATPIHPDEVEQGLEVVFPHPGASRVMKLAAAGRDAGVTEHDFLEREEKDIAVFNQRVARQDTLREAVRDAFGKFNISHPHAANSAYAFFNGVTYVTNHSDLFTGSDVKNDISLHFGAKAGINTSAFEYALSLTDLDTETE